jgi:tetratricopeptide (TPR) repeat protein
MSFGAIQSRSTRRFNSPFDRRRYAPFLIGGEETHRAPILGDTGLNRRQGYWLAILGFALVLLRFVLIDSVPAAQAQSPNPTPRSQEQKATVSVRGLQIPAKAQRLFKQGIEYLARGDAEGSQDFFRRAIQTYPSYYEAYYNLGVAESQLHQWSEALQFFQKAIDLSGGGFAHGYFGYGLVLNQLGQSNDAEKIVRRGLEQEPDLSDGYAVLSIALFNQNRLDEAEEAAQKSLRLPNASPRNALLALAHIHFKKGDYRAAAKDLESYLEAVRAAPHKHDAESDPYIQRLLSQAKARSAGQNQEGASRGDLWEPGWWN